MTDKVQKVKEEIERRISNLEQIGDREYIEKFFREQFRFIEVYESLIKFIDSIPEEPASEDLEEAASKYIEEDFHERSRADFKAGAEWQKHQMMKDAVDATILNVDAQTIEFGLWPEKLLDMKEGDKVKIIILK